MTLKELRNYVLEYLDQVDTDAFFKDATINDFLNESYRACYNLMGRIAPETVTKNVTGTISSGATELDLPNDFLSLYVFETRETTSDNYYRSKYYDYARFGEKYDDTDSARPTEFYFDKYGTNNKIKFLQKTDQDYLYNIVYKTKLVSSDLMTTDTDTPSLIPEDYHMWLVYNTAVKYLPKDHDQSRTDVMQPVLNLMRMLEQRMEDELGRFNKSNSQYLIGWRDNWQRGR